MSIEAVAWAFKQTVTPSARKFVLIALCDNADQFGICFPSIAVIQQKTALSRRAVIDNIQALQKAGLIDKAHRFRKNSSHSSNAYKIPFNNVDLSDHPLISIFEQGSAGDAPPLVQEMHQRSAVSAPPITVNIKKQKKGALSRCDFLRIVSGGFADGEFSAFDHLTESEIAAAGQACWDHWAAKDEWPGGDPVAIVRNWVRGGLAQGRIRKREAPKLDKAARPAMSPIEAQWRARLTGYIERGSWLSMFGPAPDENGCLAPLHLMNEFFPDGKIPARA